MKNLIMIAMLGMSVSLVSANDNLNQISKRPYMKTVEVKKSDTVEVKKESNKINQHSMNFISKRPYVHKTN